MPIDVRLPHPEGASMNEPRRARARAGLATLAVAAVAISGLPMTAGASSVRVAALPPGVKICGTFSGPHWSYKGKGGTQYTAYTRRGGACSFAMRWAPRLVSKHSPDATSMITGGPSGWLCANSSVHFGICTQAVGGHPTATSHAFAWFGSK